MKSGVAQESKLGPLLFLIFINDLLDVTDEATLISFADDIIVLIQHEDLDELSRIASRCLAKIHRWMQENSLVLNSSKTKALIFGKNSPSIAFKIHNPDCDRIGPCSCETIHTSKQHRFLGLLTDDDFKFKSHSHHVTSKIPAGIALLARTERICTREMRRSIYYPLIESYLRNMLPIYGGSLKSSMLRLAAMQRRAIRVLPGLP